MLVDVCSPSSSHVGSREGLTCGAAAPEAELHLPAAAWLTAAPALSNSQRIIFNFRIYMVLLSLPFRFSFTRQCSEKPTDNKI